MPKRTDTSDVIDNLLLGIAVAGALAMTIIAPNAPRALEKPLLKLVGLKDKRKEARRIAKYIKQQKLVEVREQGQDEFRIILTDKGKKRVTKARFDSLKIPNTKWDQKWRVVMFDIPESEKPTRDYISLHLRRVGFKQIQKSVFVFPYSVDEFMAILREIFPSTSQQVVYMTVEETDNHNQLVKKFRHIL